MKTTPLARAALAVTLALVLTTPARAQEDTQCQVSRPLDGQRLLRRLSIDLRGHGPSMAEQTAQRGSALVSSATVDAFLASDEFVRTMRAYHSNLLWPNIDQVDVDPLFNKLFPIELAPGEVVHFSIIRALYVRSITEPFVPCANEPAEYDRAGNLVMKPLVVGGQTVAVQEGWVMVEPYWAPGTQLKVCALDAQAQAVAPACTAASQSSPYMKQLCDQFSGFSSLFGLTLEGTPTACDSKWSVVAAGCGCGPNLQRCTTPDTAGLIRTALLEQELRLIDRVIAEDRPYTEILTAKQVELNGHLAHYLRHQSRMSFDLFGEYDLTAAVPAQLDWEDGADAWVQITRTGRHSGVLTTPGFLMKFASNRSRAHRFYNAFECSAFVPDGPLPSASEPCSKALDLTKRCGCDGCHKTLEPMSAHWGRFAEYGFTPLNEQRYPKNYAAVCTNFQDLDQIFRCFRFYQYEATDPQEEPFLGLLLPYVFRTADDVTSIEQGPSRLAQRSIESGRFAGCTVRRLWTHFMRRSPTPAEELTVIPLLQQTFVEDGYRVRGLVKQIVTHPAYGRSL